MPASWRGGAHSGGSHGIATRISNGAYERLALAEPDRKWELWDGHPRQKPGMT